MQLSCCGPLFLLLLVGTRMLLAGLHISESYDRPPAPLEIFPIQTGLKCRRLRNSGLAKGGAKGGARPLTFLRTTHLICPNPVSFLGVRGRDSDGFKYKPGSSAPLLGLIWYQ